MKTQTKFAFVLLLAAFTLALRTKSDQKVKLHIDSEKSDRFLQRAVKNINLDRFHVPLLFKYSLAQLAWLFLSWKLEPNIVPTRTQAFTVAAGNGKENVFLDWFHPSPPEDCNAPIIVYLPGITGTNKEALQLIRRICQEKRWIAAVFHRRGHNQRLQIPNFNIFGNCHDLHVVLQQVQEEFPTRRICLIGSSAGSAIMVRYLGEYGPQALAFCGVGLSPGYEIEHLWGRIKHTWLDRYLLSRLREFFIHPNREVLLERNPLAVKELETGVDSVHAFAQVACAFHEGETYQEWLKHTCPLKVAPGITVPTLCVNALDDPICLGITVQEVGYRLPYKNPYCALITTENGSHCAHQDFSSGKWLPDNWGHTVSFEFIEGLLFSQKEME